MKKEQFYKDLQAIYLELQDRQSQLNSFYGLLEGEHEKAKQSVEAFLKLLDLPSHDDTIMAALTRMVNLREDALDQVLAKLDLSDEEIRVKKELAYGFVSMMHISRHESLISWIETNKLLTPFYRALILGVHFVGLRLSEWQSHWSHHILNGINLELSEMLGGDDAKVFEYLQQNNLLDFHGEDLADRCYSVLLKDSQGYKSVAYADAFKSQVTEVAIALEQLIMLLDRHEDEVFDQKHEWISYFEALKEAFTHTKVDELVGKWAEVDRRWMAITTPLQVGHPLEYYEDHYRKAVALEWDLRIINPRLQSDSHTKDAIKLFASKMAKELPQSNSSEVISKNLLQVDQTQLYIGQPMLYYAAEFNGLFSAQVVPNDEEVSAKLGKKIFAYADFVMESKKSKPTMKLSVEIMGKEFVQKQKHLIQTNPKLWHKLYDISTIGHEFGHILWIDSDTESVMNKTGGFKNIEEFKATTGGLMAFFDKQDDELVEHIVDDLVSRAIGLMAWREVGEVLPYYCEGLIHLGILFDSQVIRFEDSIYIDYSKYNDMKELYIQSYEELAMHYLDKKDANEYLARYATKVDGVYLPKDEQIRQFVEYYYARYKEIGQQTIQI
jgi:hypothetical protein